MVEMGWFSKDGYRVVYKDNGDEKSQDFDSYDKAMAFRKELNRKRIYAYIKRC